MDIKKSNRYQKERRKRPADVILAFEEPRALGEVVLHSKWRLVIKKELSKTEFVARLANNLLEEDSVAGLAQLSGSRLDTETAMNMASVPDKMKYFYEAEVV